MNRLSLHQLFSSALLLFSLGGAAHALEPVDPLKGVLAQALVVQEDLIFAQQRFSIMSREMNELERCPARELLGASIDFREVVEESRMIGKMIDEMKYPEDAATVRKYLALTSSRLVGIGQTDIEIMDELSAKITTPEAIEMIKTMRGKMQELRGIFGKLASKP